MKFAKLRHKAKIKSKCGPIELNIEEIKKIASQKRSLIWNYDDFNLAKTRCRYFNSDSIGLNGSLASIIPFYQNGAHRQQF